MRYKKLASLSPERKRTRPALSQEARENQMIALAEDLAEQQLRDGTASSQVITHYLKLGTAREKKELELMEMEKKVKAAKVEAMKAAEDTKTLFAEAIKAFRSYAGVHDEGDEDADF